MHPIQQLDAAPFCEIYENFYFDAKHLEKGLKRGDNIEQNIKVSNDLLFQSNNIINTMNQIPLIAVPAQVGNN